MVGIGGPYKKVNCHVGSPASSESIQLIRFSLDIEILRCTDAYHIRARPPALPLEGTISEQSKPKEKANLSILEALQDLVSNKKRKLVYRRDEPPDMLNYRSPTKATTIPHYADHGWGGGKDRTRLSFLVLQSWCCSDPYGRWYRMNIYCLSFDVD